MLNEQADEVQADLLKRNAVIRIKIRFYAKMSRALKVLRNNAESVREIKA